MNNRKSVLIFYFCTVILLVVTIFIIGYLAIALEHKLNINKSATALLTAVLCWTVYIWNNNAPIVSEQLSHHLAEISEILFFLMGAMTIVELIDAHDGFEVITSRITTSREIYLLWIIGFLAFFLSAVLDNLTTAIVMVSLLRKLIADGNKRLLYVGIVVIAANAGGAWSPIGDVTTTMLWIGGQITASNIMLKLFLPSLVSLLIPLLAASFQLKGNVVRPESVVKKNSLANRKERKIVFFTGIGALLFVPVFKTVTHLPPYMGVLFGLSIMWMVTEIMHHTKNEETRDVYSVSSALQKIDVPSILFFLGILLAVAVLQSTEVLAGTAHWMDEKIGNETMISGIIGLLSAIVDNVPLVAATMGMYDLAQHPTDSYLWELIAYCAGTGGSILIIGSAPGVAAMGLEKIKFFWYLKNISWLALLGYIGGILVYAGMN